VSADGKDTAARLVAAMWSWRAAAENFDRPRPIVLPTPKEIQLETVMLPRDAFFAAVEQVPAEKRSGASPPNRSPRTRPAFPQSCRGSGSPTPSSGIYALDWPRA
jgi:lysine decarboxylase